MLTLIFTAFLGAYAAQRIKICNNQGVWQILINYQQIWQDFLEALQMLESLRVRSIGFGRVSRNYFDSSITPWLSQSFGVSLKIPTLNLPALPTPQK
ncbi:hypothetical protein Q2T42_25655 [Leptolyngbya boryana CZ1]|uniref:Uncharacterized protein n=1 Tax=Leptolyngbya boryana CZ1 TaxID=3060204 RepID=A0AA96WT39_LEPBY|nr:hypothetical protein [Leptolyngbya boryana]WNZ45177.1 hypothetical protein Q2T42_25655 [Leptolyngbya boryana CZ1]